MVKIEVIYPTPSWLCKNGLNKFNRIAGLFYAENDSRLIDFMYKWNLKYSEKYLCFTSTEKGMILYINSKSDAVLIANLVRNIHVAMNNSKRMSARIVK